jgi:hypothetical protein
MKITATITRLSLLLPYWLNHAIIALVMALALWAAFPIFTACFIPGFFYVAREVEDWLGPKGDERVAEGLPRFDIPGAVAPAAALLALFSVVTVLS